MFIKSFLTTSLFVFYFCDLQASTQENKFLKSAKNYIEGSTAHFDLCPLSLSNDTIGILPSKKLAGMGKNFEILKNISKEGKISCSKEKFLDYVLTTCSKNFKLKKIRSSMFKNIFSQKKICRENNINEDDILNENWTIYLEEVESCEGKIKTRKDKILPQDLINNNNEQLIVNTLKKALSKNIHLKIQHYILSNILNIPLSLKNASESYQENHRIFNILLLIPNQLISQLSSLNKNELNDYLNEIRKKKKEYISHINNKLMNITSIQSKYQTEFHELNNQFSSKNYLRFFHPEEKNRDLKFEIQRQLFFARYYYILSKISLYGPTESNTLIMEGQLYHQQKNVAELLEKTISSLKNEIENEKKTLSLFKNKVIIINSQNKELNNKIQDLESSLISQKKISESEKEKLEKENENLEKTLKFERKQKDILNSKLVKANEKNQDQIKVQKTLKNKINESNQQVHSTEEKLKFEQKQNNTLTENITENKNGYELKISHLNQKINLLLQELHQGKETVVKFSEKEKILTKSLEEMTLSLQNTQKVNELSIQKQLKEVKEENEKLKCYLYNEIETSQTHEKILIENSYLFTKLNSRGLLLEKHNLQLITENQKLTQILKNDRNFLFLNSLNTELINENGILRNRISGLENKVNELEKEINKSSQSTEKGEKD